MGAAPVVHSASVMGVGGQTLNPSFQSETSVSNPATWSNLNFTRLNISYINDQSMFNSFEGMSGQTMIGTGQMIVPIKEKHSLGFGIAPYRNQSIQIQGSESNFVAFGDTITTHKSLITNGGINDLFFGFGTSIGENVLFGSKMHLLFGSARQSLKNQFGGVTSIKHNRYSYSGVLIDGYFTFNVIPKITLNGMMQFSYKPLRYIVKEYHPFDDVNQSGFHDNDIYLSDFPLLSDVGNPVESIVEKAHSPSQYQFGVQWAVRETSSILGEFSVWKDASIVNNHIYVFPLNDFVNKRQDYRLGFIRFTPNLLAPKFLDKFQFRTGIQKSNYISKNENTITDNSISFGLGFKFKATTNQIDIAYRIGERKYSESLGNENYQQMMIELTLSDVWFVRRRAR